MKKFHHIIETSFPIILDALNRDDRDVLIKELSHKHPADISDLYEDLRTKFRMKILELCPEIFTANVLKYLSPFFRIEIISRLGIDHFKKAINKWSDDKIIALLEDLDPREQAQLIGILDDRHKPTLDILKKYDQESVGREMSLDFITIPVSWNVEKALQYVKSHDKLTEDTAEVFVVNGSLNPIGSVSISNLISSDKDAQIQDIAKFDTITINANADQEMAYTLFNKYRMSCIPVVENSGRIIGVLRADDILRIVEQEVTEDYLTLGGVQGDKLTESVMFSSFARLRWLAVSFINALLSPLIINLFQDTIQKTIALATLMPIVGSIGGNIGIQTVSVIIKAFSGKQLRKKQYLEIISKEAVVGSINGLVIGLILCVLAALFFKSAVIGGILGTSMFFCAMWAACLGSALPILFDKLGYNAALSSGPLVTAITDVSGFIIFLGISKHILG